MRIKRYVVNKLEEARSQIIRDLGKDAIIIHTNRIRASGIKGFFGKHYIEVLAAAEEKKEKNSINIKKDEILSEPLETIVESKNTNNDDLEEVKKELLENRKLLNTVISDLEQVTSQFPPQYNKIFKTLVNEGITVDKAKKLIIKLRSKFSNTDTISQDIRELMIQEISPILSKAAIPNNQRSSLALVGPTGVGKTTTIAKLAAHASLNDKRTIGLITLDNFRVAAAEQLKVYGEILDVPVLTANTIKDYQEAVKKLKDKERIYVDTAGRGHKSVEELKEIKNYFDKLSLDYIFLTISVTTSFEDLLPTFKTYSIFEPAGLIITKLDEVERYGNIYNIITHFQKPIYYFTTGQSVPDDIEVLSAETIVDKILGGSHE